MNFKSLIIFLFAAIASALCATFVSPFIAIIIFSVTATVCFGKYGFFVLIPTLVSLCLSYVTGGLNAVSALVLAMPASFVLGFCFWKKLTFGNTLAFSSLAETLVLFAGIFYLSKKEGTTAVKLIFGEPADMLALFNFAGQEKEMLSDMLEYMFYLYDALLPFLLIVSSAVLVYLIFGISRFLLEKSGEAYDMPYFYELRVPRSMMTVFLILAILSLIGGIYSPILLNVLFILATVIIICGLSVMSFYFKKINVPKVLRILILIAGILFLSPIAEFSLLFLGIRDSYRNFRSLQN